MAFMTHEKPLDRNVGYVRASHKQGTGDKGWGIGERQL
jgi:hypothetical protein